MHLAVATKRLLSFPHVGLQVAQLLIALVEDFQLRAPGPPDTQAPLHVFLLKTTHDRVLCHERCFPQDSERKREEEVTQCTVCGKGDKVIYLTSY